MALFLKAKGKSAEIPYDCVGLTAEIHSSICNGEKTIGFYEPKSKALLYSELIKNESDIVNYCSKYGIDISAVKKKY